MQMYCVDLTPTKNLDKRNDRYCFLLVCVPVLKSRTTFGLIGTHPFYPPWC